MTLFVASESRNSDQARISSVPLHDCHMNRLFSVAQTLFIFLAYPPVFFRYAGLLSYLSLILALREQFSVSLIYHTELKSVPHLNTAVTCGMGFCLPRFPCLIRIKWKTIWLVDDSSLISTSRSLAHCQAVLSLSFSAVIILIFHSELASSVSIPVTFSRFCCIQTASHCHQVSVAWYLTFLHELYFSPRNSKLWNTLSLYAFLLTYNLTLFKDRTNKLILAWIFPSLAPLCLLTMGFTSYTALQFMRNKNKPRVITVRIRPHKHKQKILQGNIDIKQALLVVIVK